MTSDPLAIQVERRIYLIRGEKVMLDSDLGWLYDIEAKALNKAVKRNKDRFSPMSILLATRGAGKEI